MKLKTNAFSVSFLPFEALDTANAGVPGGGGARGGARQLGESGYETLRHESLNRTDALLAADAERDSRRAESGRVLSHRERELHETGPPFHQDVVMAKQTIRYDHSVSTVASAPLMRSSLISRQEMRTNVMATPARRTSQGTAILSE